MFHDLCVGANTGKALLPGVSQPHSSLNSTLALPSSSKSRLCVILRTYTKICPVPLTLCVLGWIVFSGWGLLTQSILDTVVLETEVSRECLRNYSRCMYFHVEYIYIFWVPPALDRDTHY